VSARVAELLENLGAAHLFKITSDNDMVQILYGGDVFHPLLGAPDIVLTLVQLSAVTVFAAVYPMSVARGITPLDAISKD